jgi:hypothetical protein
MSATCHLSTGSPLAFGRMVPHFGPFSYAKVKGYKAGIQSKKWDKMGIRK